MGREGGKVKGNGPIRLMNIGIFQGTIGNRLCATFCEFINHKNGLF